MSRLTDLLNNPPADADACWIWTGSLTPAGYPCAGDLALDLSVAMGRLRPRLHTAPTTFTTRAAAKAWLTALDG